MDFTKLKRDREAVLGAIKVVGGKSIVCTKKVQLTIPQSYIQDNLVDQGEIPMVVGYFAIIVDDTYYGVSSALAKVPLTPDEVSTYSFEDETYMLYTFYPGATIIPNRALVKVNVLAYEAYMTMLSKGNVPAYFNITDKLNIFTSSVRHASVDTGCDFAIHGIHSALLARDPKDYRKYWRHTVKTQEEFDTVRPTFVGAKNVSVAREGTLSNIGTAYASEGFVGALVNPNMKRDPLEDILMGKVPEK